MGALTFISPGGGGGVITEPQLPAHADSHDQGGIDRFYDDFGHLSNARIESFDRLMTASGTPVSGNFYCAFFVARMTLVINTIGCYIQTAGVTMTHFQLGAYVWINDTAIQYLNGTADVPASAQGTGYVKTPLAGPVTLARGARYALGLWAAGTTMPVMRVANSVAGLAALPPAIAGVISAAAALPVAANNALNVSSTGTIPWMTGE